MNQPYGCWLQAFLPVSHCTGGWAGRNPSSFSQEKHREAQNQLWLHCMSHLFYSLLREKHPVCIWYLHESQKQNHTCKKHSRPWGHCPHCLAKTHSPNCDTSRPAASCQQAPNLRITAGARAKEQLSLQISFTKQSLFFRAASCKGERTTALLQVAGKIQVS